MKVSILIPVYNSAPYLRETIESALKQTWEDKEIIIVDDGSKDASFEIAKTFESGNVRVTRQENAGACRARNEAFRLSSGDYIQYLDADDLLSPGKIANQMKFVSDHEALAVLSGSWVHFRDGDDVNRLAVPRRFLDNDWDVPVNWLLNTWTGKGMTMNSAWLTPRHLVEKAGPWNEKLSINQDGEFFCRVLLAAQAIKFAPNAYSYYRTGIVGSISQTKTRQKAADLLASYVLYKQHVLKIYPDDVKVKEALTYLFYTFIYLYFELYPELTAVADEHIQELGINKNNVGGRFFRLSTSVLGFTNTLRLRQIANRLTGRGGNMKANSVL